MKEAIDDIISEMMAQRNDFHEYVNWLGDVRFAAELDAAKFCLDELINLKSVLSEPITLKQSEAILIS